jgi:hypothetical protein
MILKVEINTTHQLWKVESLFNELELKYERGDKDVAVQKEGVHELGELQSKN